MAFAALLSFAPAIILLQFCFNPLYKIYSLECISEPACFSLKNIKYFLHHRIHLYNKNGGTVFRSAETVEKPRG